MVYIKRKQQNRNKDKNSLTKNKEKKLTHEAAICAQLSLKISSPPFRDTRIPQQMNGTSHVFCTTFGPMQLTIAIEISTSREDTYL